MSNNVIADHCGVSDMLVGDVRRELQESCTSPPAQKRKGKDGKSYPAKKPKPKPEPTKPTVQVLDEPDDEDTLQDASDRARASDILDELERILARLGVKRDRELAAIRSAVEE